MTSVFTWASGLGVIAVYALCAALHGQFIPVALSAPFYVMTIPLFSILIPIYAWSNTHDLSWGTRPTAEAARAVAAEVQEKLKGDDEAARTTFRSLVLIFWIGCNWLFAQVLSVSSGLATATTVTYTSSGLLVYGYTLGSLTVFVLGTRLLFSTVYALNEIVRGTCCTVRHR